MNEENDSVGVPSAFQTGQGFPTTDSPTVEDKEEAGYTHVVMEPEPVDHPFPQPDIPNTPKTRADFERACKTYAKWVLHEYADVIPLEWDRVTVLDDGRFKRAIGKCGTNGYHTARVRISWAHYTKKNYSWESMQQTIRHELVHAWQARWLGYTSHGPTFVKKAEQMDCDRLGRYDGKSEPNHVMVCQNCGSSYTRQRACKATKRTNHYKCSACDMVEREFEDAEETGGLWIHHDNPDWHIVLD